MSKKNIFEQIVLANELQANNGVVKHKPKAAIYTRVGNPDMLGISAQKHLCEEYAERKGLKVLDTFCDSGASGVGTNHPALDNLLLQAKDGAFEYVIVSGLDRISRKFEYVLATMHELKKYGVEVISAKEGL